MKRGHGAKGAAHRAVRARRRTQRDGSPGPGDARRHVRPPARVDCRRPDFDVRHHRPEARRSLLADTAPVEQHDRRTRDGLVDGAAHVESDDDDRRERRLLQLGRRLAEWAADAGRRDRAPSGIRTFGGRRRPLRDPARRPRPVGRELARSEHARLSRRRAERAAAPERRLPLHARVGCDDTGGERDRGGARAVPAGGSVHRSDRERQCRRQRQRGGDPARRRRSRRARSGCSGRADRRRRRKPGAGAPRAATRLEHRHRCRQRRAVPRQEREARRQRGGSAFDRPAVRARSEDSDRATGGRPHRPRCRRRAPPRLERRDHEQRSRADAYARRLRHGFRARFRRVDHGGVRRCAAQPAVRSRR